jgi:hypothetical protein
VVVAVGIVCGWCADGEAQELASFELRVGNAANGPEAVVTSALSAVQAIYQRAAISAHVEETHQGNPLIITAVLVDSSAMHRTRDNVLGVAAESRVGCGRVAYVFWDRVRELARARRYAVATVLAMAIAHEVGHLLLPPGSHAMTGLMQPQWRDDDFRLAEEGTLGFSDGEARRMRDRIIRERTPRVLIP